MISMKQNSITTVLNSVAPDKMHNIPEQFLPIYMTIVALDYLPQRKAHIIFNISSQRDHLWRNTLQDSLQKKCWYDLVLNNVQQSKTFLKMNTLKICRCPVMWDDECAIWLNQNFCLLLMVCVPLLLPHP